MATITIDSLEYDLEELSEEAKELITKLQLADEEIKSLQTRLEMLGNARNAYVDAYMIALFKK